MTLAGTILLVFALTLVLNVIPVFMPPTWMLLAWFSFNTDVPVLVLAATGAVAAMTGRGLLALGFRRLGMRFLPERWQRNIEELGRQAGQRKQASLVAYVVFLLGPFPSEQLFIAMGIAQTPLVVPLLVFLCIRLIGYLVWVSTANVVAMSLQDVLRPGPGSTLGIVIQVVSLLLLFAAMQIDWAKWFRERKPA